MNKGYLMVLAVMLGLCCRSNVHAQQVAGSSKMQWWQDARFGLFLHWGLYSATAGDWKGHRTSRGEQFMMVEKIPVKEYAHIADTFNPVKFNADSWVLMAKKAGMKYVIITAKHHDGFAMYHSTVSDYNIVKRTPYARDPMAALADACHRHGLKFGFYYSLGRDWEDPDAATNWPVKGGRSNTWDFPNEDEKDVTRYFHRKLMPQIRELVTQYGVVDVLWFDTPELTPKCESEALLDTIHKYQPGCIVNSRIGNALGDYRVYEQSVVNDIMHQPWESCVTISANWAYNRHDTAWKPANVLIRQLADIVSKGGNYLLNLSPKGDGTFAPQAISRIDSVGDWLRVNGEAIYNTRPWKIFGETDSVFLKPVQKRVLTAAEKDALDAVNDATSKDLYPTIRFTAKGAYVYAIICNPASRKVTINALAPDGGLPVTSVEMPGYAGRIKWTQKKQSLQVSLPEQIKTTLPVYVLKIRCSNSRM